MFTPISSILLKSLLLNDENIEKVKIADFIFIMLPIVILDASKFGIGKIDTRREPTLTGSPTLLVAIFSIVVMYWVVGST